MHFLCTVIEKTTDEPVKWPWRDTIRKVVPDIGRTMEVHIRTVTNTALSEVETELGKSKTVIITAVPENLVGGHLDYPKAISKVGLVCLRCRITDHVDHCGYIVYISYRHVHVCRLENKVIASNKSLISAFLFYMF